MNLSDSEMRQRQGIELPNGLGDVRRILTGFDEQNRSTVLSTVPCPHVKDAAAATGIRFAEIWNTPSNTPEEDNDYDAGGHAPEAMNPTDPRGTLVRLAEIGRDPNEDPAATMHSTNTIDYVVILSGTVFGVFEDGTELECFPGDIAIVRGVPHAWSNKNDEPCIALFVLVGAPDHGTRGGGQNFVGAGD